MTENLGDRLILNEISPAYWQVTIDNPPINMYDPRMFAAFNQLMDRLDTADELRVVVFDSAPRQRWVSNHAVTGTTTWLATQGRIGRLMAAGLQKDGDFELALGHNVGIVD